MSQKRVPAIEEKKNTSSAHICCRGRRFSFSTENFFCHISFRLPFQFSRLWSFSLAAPLSMVCLVSINLLLIEIIKCYFFHRSNGRPILSTFENNFASNSWKWKSLGSIVPKRTYLFAGRLFLHFNDTSPKTTPKTKTMSDRSVDFNGFRPIHQSGFSCFLQCSIQWIHFESRTSVRH